jgi:hypothetical protein
MNNIINIVISDLQKKEEIIKIIIKNYNQKLRNIYYSDYQPPGEFIDNIDLDNYKKCIVFYNKGDDVNDIKKLIREREPVNIFMERHYNQDELENVFGFKTGAYDKIKITEGSITPPNIMIYTPAKLLETHNVQDTVHILNVIGLAFDSKKQLDYQQYSKLDTVEDAINEAKKFYIKLFKNIFKVAEKLKMKNIIMSLVGANNFAEKWLYWAYKKIFEKINNGGKENFQLGVWLEAWKEAEKFIPQGITIYSMGMTKFVAYTEYFNKYDALEDFPGNAINFSNGDLSETLFINAWDCWSVPGNGNGEDRSLDGFMGRNTDIGFKGTSMTNIFLEDNLIELE